MVLVMRKTLLSFGMLAAAAIAFVGCTEKELVSDVKPVTHTMTINLGKAIDTKTAVVEGETEASYVWTEGDNKYFHVYESTFDAEGKESKTEGTINEVIYSEDKTTASLNVSFTGTAKGPYTYRVVYANTVSGSKNPLIPAEQSPKANSYDPAADVLVSRPIESETRVESVEMTMGRAATINKMTLKGLVAGEKVSKVTLTTDKSLSAYYAISTQNYSANAKTLTFTFDNVEVGAEGTFPVYFVSAPVEGAAIESVVVTTDKNVYTKSSSLNPNPFDGKTITFAVGTMKRFGMDMAGYGKPISEPVEYTLVDNAVKISDKAEYLIVNKDGTKAFGAYVSGEKAYFGLEDITSTGNVITITSEQVNVVTLESAETDGQFYIKTADGNYLYYTGANNAVFSGEKKAEDAYLWTVAIDRITNVGTTERYLQYNSANSRFACYISASKQEDVVLYVNEATLIPSLKTPSGLGAISEGNTVTIAWDSVENAESYIVTCGERTETTTDTKIEFTDLADGLYDVTVVATTSNPGYKDSEPAVTNVRVGSVSKSKVYFSINGVLSEGTELEEGVNITFPSDPSVEDASFAGWTTSSISGTQDNAPVFVNTKSEVMGSADVTYYAVFASESLSQTLQYDTWTYSGSTTNKSSYRLFHKDSYIESESFDLGKLSKVVVYGGTFGGTSYNSLTISVGTNIWKDVTVSGKSETGVNTYTDGNPLTGTGKLRITSNSGTASSNGVRISKVEIYVMSAYCTNVVAATGISVSGTPTKKEYEDGNVFDPSGLVVTKSFNDGSSEVVTSGIKWSFDPAVLREGTTSVSVTATVGDLVSAPYSVTGLIVNKSTSSGNTEVAFEFNYTTTDTKTGDWSLEKDDVKLSWSKGSNQYTPSPNKEGSIRMYSGTILTITVPEGKNITKVVFTSTSNTYTAENLKYNDVALPSNTWELSTPANPVVLTAAANARFKSITVTYK